MSKFLVIGGVRSGKSSHAEALAKEISDSANLGVYYIAMAEAIDEEMEKRIQAHQMRRNANWKVMECTTKLSESLKRLDSKCVVLIDCLTLWLNNCLYYQESDWQTEKENFIDWLKATDHEVIMVTNEVGFSITPDNPLARQFADQQGWLNQDVAQCVDYVTLTIAGIPHVIKSN